MKRIILFLTLLSIASILVFGDKVFLHFPAISKGLDGKLSLVQTKSIDILIDMTKLLISFSMAVIGGLSFFVKEGKKSGLVFNSYELLLLVASASSSILAMYCGHLVIINIAEMLANDFVNILDTVVTLPVRLQYIFLIMSIVLLICFAYVVQLPAKDKND